MKYYAIRKKDKSGKYVAGTDFTQSVTKPRQMLSNEIRPPLLFTERTIEVELRHRHVDLERYEVVTVEVRESRAGLKVKKGENDVPEIHLCRDCEYVLVYPLNEPCKTCLRLAEHPSYVERVKV